MVVHVVPDTREECSQCELPYRSARVYLSRWSDCPAPASTPGTTDTTHEIPEGSLQRPLSPQIILAVLIGAREKGDKEFIRPSTGRKIEVDKGQVELNSAI